MNDNPLQTYRSLEEIRMRKEMLRRELQKDNGQIKETWQGLFHSEKSNTPSRRMSGFISTGAGVMDGIILGWKLYRKFYGGKNNKDKKQEEKRVFRISEKEIKEPRKT